ncbi:hypothetical protein MPC4_220017 [Methylocella tundrae]|uniref:Uncharacterized protein n=1 Tax=Methylocella tundrae TaxID=227605 RepID=A0A8B6M5K8_METTU|nr:hypothetical protein MPC1_1610004 [Methylocella tundrae]VTZ50287.1 hypothetical protein MPC4_220017 [Methylocella tundrae]
MVKAGAGGGLQSLARSHLTEAIWSRPRDAVASGNKRTASLQLRSRARNSHGETNGWLTFACRPR